MVTLRGWAGWAPTAWVLHWGLAAPMAGYATRTRGRTRGISQRSPGGLLLDDQLDVEVEGTVHTVRYLESQGKGTGQVRRTGDRLAPVVAAGVRVVQNEKDGKKAEHRPGAGAGRVGGEKGGGIGRTHRTGR